MANRAPICNRLDDLVRESPFSTSVSTHRHVSSWGLSHSNMQLCPSCINDIYVGYPALMTLRNTARISVDINGDERGPHETVLGELLVRPSGFRYSAKYHTLVDITVFELQPDMFRAIVQNEHADLDDVMSNRNMVPFMSPFLSQLMLQLETQSAQADTTDPLYMDSLIQIICNELWRVLLGTQATEANSGESLKPAQMQRIVDYIDDARDCRLNLTVLSKLTDIPVSRMRAVFQHSFGQSPYQYVLGRKINRARCYVETTDLPIAQVAYLCGFSSQSHMTDVFRTKLGVTPKKLRDLCK